MSSRTEQVSSLTKSIGTSETAFRLSWIIADDFSLRLCTSWSKFRLPEHSKGDLAFADGVVRGDRCTAVRVTRAAPQHVPALLRFLCRQSVTSLLHFIVAARYLSVNMLSLLQRQQTCVHLHVLCVSMLCVSVLDEFNLNESQFEGRVVPLDALLPLSMAVTHALYMPRTATPIWAAIERLRHRLPSLKRSARVFFSNVARVHRLVVGVSVMVTPLALHASVIKGTLFGAA